MMSLLIVGCGGNAGQNTESTAGSTEAAASTAATTTGPAMGQTALGNSGAENDGTTVNFWSLFGGADGAQMVEMLNAYNATNPKVKISQATQDWDNYYTKLKTSILGGEAPDLCISHDVYVWGLIKEGCLTPIDDEAAKVGVNLDYGNYVQKIEDLKYDNHYYAIPVDCLQILFSYNKDIVGKAGLLDEAGLPKIEAGAESFYKFLDTLKSNTDVAPFGTILTTGSVPMYLFNSLYFQYGGSKPFVSDDGKTWQMDNEIGLKAAETYQKIASYSLPNIQNLAEIFVGGKCATALDGAWQMNYFYEQLGASRYGVIKLPQFGPTYKTAVYGHQFVLPVSSTRSDEKTAGALEFVKWFSENNAMWSKAGSMPAYKPAQDSDLFKKLPMHKYFQDAPNYSTLLTFTAPFALKGSPEMNEPLGKLARKEVTPQQCLDEMAQRMGTALK
jgi:multiple sugar transport system substrate-binding protein